MKLNSIKNYSVFTDFFILHNNNLIMTSLYGSEQVIKSILANIDLKTLKYLDLEYAHVRLNINDPSELKSIKKKIINDVYDDMYHYMVYSSRIKYVEGDISTYVVSQKDGHRQAVWNKVKAMTATPLLDHWQDQIIGYLASKNKIIECDVYGKTSISCSYIELESLTFLNDFVSNTVKNGVLKI